MTVVVKKFVEFNSLESNLEIRMKMVDEVK